MDDLISRQAAQTKLQLSARRYTVAHEAHGEGRVVWSEDLISVSDAMDVLRKIPSAEPTFDARDTQYNLPIGTDCISRQAAIDIVRHECGEWTGLAKEIVKQFSGLPSAQLENIRCAECKWFQCNMRQDGYLPKGVDEFECRHWCGYCDPTDFCSYAERREVTT